MGLQIVAVAKSLSNPHCIVARVQKALGRAKPDGRGLLNPKGKAVLPISIGPGSIDRSLLFLDAFMKTCEALAMKVKVLVDEHRSETAPYGSSQGQPVYPRACYSNTPTVHVDGEWFTFHLEERTQRQPKPVTIEERKRQESKGQFSSQSHDFVPNGRLCFHIEKGSFRDHTRWQDKKRWRIEEGIGEMVQRLRELAQEVKKRRVEEAEAKEREAKAEERRRELERLRAVEVVRSKKLYCDVKAWRYASDAREFISCVRANLSDASMESRKAIEDWLSWAERHLRKVDPLAGPAPTLEEYDNSRDKTYGAYRGSYSYSSGYGSSEESEYPIWLKQRF